MKAVALVWKPVVIYIKIWLNCFILTVLTVALVFSKKFPAYLFFLMFFILSRRHQEYVTWGLRVNPVPVEKMPWFVLCAYV